MGPGPINADPRVLRAMAAQLVGQYDPAMTGYMTETQAFYRTVFGTTNEHTLLVDGTARAGIEAALVSLIDGARECARLLVEEGLPEAVERHRRHGAAMLAGVQALGLDTFGDLGHKMNNVVAVVIPDGVNGDSVRGALLNDFGIEIGTSFGPLHGKVWRIGTMGYNARQDTVLTTFAALEQVLRRAGASVVGGSGVGAAYDVYADNARQDAL
ncbi:alanine--glyoxylate aminotransferase family protein [Cryobacterium sp. N21]|uniref:alanine--glyoxylate aminotransferase family protein n=1 Tax=Cryobacterium sp. N21 TaxID=2048289 RepID=UPI000CE32F41|nr:alanine--glyoxylate aminotransferase family protein [Cryobacterium sp. N21]